MKTMMRNGKTIRRSVSLLLMMSLLIALLPLTAAVAVTTPGAYGTVTVTAKNVVIRNSAAGSRTGYFAQPGEYPMIGPAVVKDGVTWYNLQTDKASGYVHGSYAKGNYGGAGMPSTEKVYLKLTAATDFLKGSDPANPDSTTPVPFGVGTVLQLVSATPVTATYGGTTSQYIKVYKPNDDTETQYHTKYTAAIQGDVLSMDGFNAYIADITWKSAITESRVLDVKGDFLTHAIQAALKILGYYEDDVDGNYGPNTYAAVQKFQDKNGLSDSGAANTATIAKLFPQATTQLTYLRSNPGLVLDSGDGGSGGGVTGDNKIKTTVKKLRIRKSYSTSSTYLGMIELPGTILEYSKTQLSGSVTWYYIQYQGITGWVMGTYVESTSSSSGGGTTTITDYGTVTITKKWTQIRKSPAGAQTGYHLNIGDVATMIGPSSETGGYVWYNIRTANGRTGWVRGDCATADFGSAGMPDTEKSYVKLAKDTTINVGSSPATPGSAVAVLKGTVLQLTGSSYNYSGTNYIDLYYDNEVHYTVYDADLISGLLTTDDLNKYIINTVWPTGLPSGEQAGETLGGSTTLRTSDIYVHAIQAALFELGADVHVALPHYRRMFHVDVGRLINDELRVYKSVLPDSRIHLAQDRIFYYRDEVYSNYHVDSHRVALAFQREVIN
ncbi:MAG: peptidoglycan-binding protein, partial [Firmicutes bacterium]|nr:peptidoglycan-binding protein [Bacillota bacterium]